jgi:uncharacterized protein YbaR (Trm112 family)
LLSFSGEPFSKRFSGRLRIKRFKAVAISADLLEILACPACKAKVELKPDSSGLKCTECKRVYPIRDDIPVMLIDEAVIENEESAGKA